MIRGALADLDIPDEVDSYVWRIVLSPRIASGLIEIERDWTMTDVALAHLHLDVSEDVETAVRSALAAR